MKLHLPQCWSYCAITDPFTHSHLSLSVHIRPISAIDFQTPTATMEILLVMAADAIDFQTPTATMKVLVITAADAIETSPVRIFIFPLYGLWYWR